MKKARLLFATLFAAVLLVACGGAKSLQVNDVWARPGLADGNSAVYFVIDNGTAADDTLLSVSSDIAQSVEMHMTMMENDTAQMMPQTTVSVPKGKTEFKPGGLHVMLVGLKKNLKVGDTFNVTLNFQSGGAQTLTATVKNQ